MATKPLDASSAGARDDDRSAVKAGAAGAGPPGSATGVAADEETSARRPADEPDDAPDAGSHDVDGSDEETAGVTSPGMAHDALFKALFGDPAHAAAALRSILPARVAACIDFGSLALEHASMVTKELRQRHGDLLFSAKLRHGDGEILLSVLFEHQSTVARDMAWRATEKVVYHMGEWRKRHDTRSVPPTLSVVVYNGTQSWTAPMDVVELMGLPAEVRDALGEHLLSFRYVLDDLRQASDDDLAARDLDPGLRLGLVAMKYARSEQLVDRLVAHQADIRLLLASERGRETWFILLRYIWLTNPHADRDALVHRLVPVVGPEMEQTMLTYGQKLEKKGYDEGIKKGVEQGRAEGQQASLLLQLTQRFGALPAALEARVRQAPHADLQRWTKRILDAATLDEVFADS